MRVRLRRNRHLLVDRDLRALGKDCEHTRAEIGALDVAHGERFLLVDLSEAQGLRRSSVKVNLDADVELFLRCGSGREADEGQASEADLPRLGMLYERGPGSPPSSP